jgi:GxxExxY protein
MNGQITNHEQQREPSEAADRLAYRVIGAAIEVHRILGPGFLEEVYEEALCVELSLRDIPFARQVSIGVDYKGNVVGQSRMDLLVGDHLVVELKAVECIAPIHVAQLLSCLKSAKLRLGLLITFNVPVSSRRSEAGGFHVVSLALWRLI